MIAAESKIVVNRAMSLDGFVAGPEDAMDWVSEFVPADDLVQQASMTGAMLVGRRTWDVGARMEAERSGSGDYPFWGPVFVLTHSAPEQSTPGVTFLSGDIRRAVEKARSAAGDKDLEILGSDVAGQCLQHGLVDELLVYVVPVVLGDGTRLVPGGLSRIELSPISSRRSGPVTVLRFGVGSRAAR